MKDKKSKTVLHGFIEFAKKSKYKPNKLRVDQGRVFYNSPIQKWLDNNDILIYSNHNECKSIVAERFIIILRNKTYKRFTANDSYTFLSYLDKLVDEYNNTYRCFIQKSIQDNYI